MSEPFPGRARSPSGPRPPTRTCPHPARSTPAHAPRISTSPTNAALQPVVAAATRPCLPKARPDDAPRQCRTGTRSRRGRARSACRVRRAATKACAPLRSSASCTKPCRSSRRFQAASPARSPRRSRPAGPDRRVGRRRSASSRRRTRRTPKAARQAPPSQTTDGNATREPTRIAPNGTATRRRRRPQSRPAPTGQSTSARSSMHILVPEHSSPCATSVSYFSPPLLRFVAERVRGHACRVPTGRTGIFPIVPQRDGPHLSRPKW